jgi:hypothetical protein
MRADNPFLTHIFDLSRPNYLQRKHLNKLQNLLFAKFDEGQHGKMLEYIYTTSNARLASATRAHYEITGTSWRRLGFTQENPRLDIMECGELGISCLTYFLRNQKTVALRMLNSRVRRDDFDELQYPWATIGIKMVRLLAAMFELYDPTTKQFTDCLKFKAQPFWHFFNRSDGFFRVFVASFVLFDTYWTSTLQRQYVVNEFNFQFGITVDWEIVVWMFHDVLYDIFNHCASISDLEAYSMEEYAFSVLNDDAENRLYQQFLRCSSNCSPLRSPLSKRKFHRRVADLDDDITSNSNFQNCVNDSLSSDVEEDAVRLILQQNAMFRLGNVKDSAHVSAETDSCSSYLRML